MTEDSGNTNGVLEDEIGSAPDVGSSLKPENRTINSVNQAVSVGETLISDWKKGILNSARITAKLNGERPYNQKKLKDANKDYKTNISTGFLASECNKVLPRLYMPIKTAKYLTAATLPSGYPDGEAKTNFFRETITEAIRSWPKFNFYIRGLAREVGIFGFGFNAFFDEYDWRPTLIRMDKGFIPQGTEVMDLEPQFFLAKYAYAPDELISLVKQSDDASRTEWKKKNVVAAINSAQPPAVDATYPNARSYEEMVRQATWGYRYAKGAKQIATWHLFSKEATGKVSHYILVADASSVGANPSPREMADSVANASDARLLYENLDQYESMTDVVNTMVFDFGDGTVHGSWGAGQILYDLAAQVEKVRCDSVDNMRMSNKMKIQVPEGKNINDVKLQINDTMMVVSGATIAGNVSGITQDINGYELLDQKLTQIAQSKLGAFVPPIPLQPSDIKAAQVNAAMAKERELQEALLENWLIQWAVVSWTISKRLCKKDSYDDVAKKTRKKLLEKMTTQEIDMLLESFPVQSVMDFTEYAASKRGAFAQSVLNNPLFNQTQAARFMAQGIGDERFVDSIVVPEGDQSEVIAQQSKQKLENAALNMGETMPVLSNDNDWVHMQTMKETLVPMLQQQLPPEALPKLQNALQHYSAHYTQGVGKKKIPKDQINTEKQFIAQAEKVLEQHQQQAQIAQQRQAAQQAMQQGQTPQGLPPMDGTGAPPVGM